MQDLCTNDRKNRYFFSRKEAAKYNDQLNSRAAAADMLGVSETSLRNYELGLAPVPEDVVVRMADLYNAPELENHYCMNECPIGKHIGHVLSCDVKELDRVTCTFLYHSDTEKLQAIRKTVLRIASDGRLEPSERGELAVALNQLEALVRDINDLRLILTKEAGDGTC